MRSRVLAFLIVIVYRLLASTWRLTLVENDELRRRINAGQPVTFAIWHGDELALLAFARRYSVATMTSTSRDGDLMDQALRYFGFKTSRGSSTRGGARALAGILRLARKGSNPVVAVDGPKGPIHRVKPGVIEIAKKLECPIFPAGLANTNAHVFRKSWNQAYLPLPFAKVTLVWGAAMGVPDSVDSRDESLARELERRLFEARDEAAKLIAST